jgi:hypothetical protein
MSQILNIFGKDTRRFWPEIVLSIAVNFGFAIAYRNQWTVFHDPILRQQANLITGSLSVLTIAGWWLTIARAVHAEPLVGDRQFWITRPYEWTKLLAAKVLFVAAWIGVPYLLAQSLMLAEVGFSPLAHLPGLLVNLLAMSAVFVLPIFSVAAVTQNFARLTITLLACLAIFTGYMFLVNGVPSAGYMASNPYSNRVLYPLLFCGCALAIALEYATRRTWLVRGVLLALPLLLVASEAAYRGQYLVDRAFPQPSAGAAAPVSMVHASGDQASDSARSENGQDYINLPIRFSGVAEGYAVTTADVKFTLTAADGKSWTSPWQQTGDRIGPDGKSSHLSLMLSPELYNRFKSSPVTVEITFAVSRYQADMVTTLPYPTLDQPVPGLGICSAESGFMNDLLCRTPLREPRLIHAVETWSIAPCFGSSAPPGATTRAEAWYEPGNPDFRLTSVWVTHLFFNSGDQFLYQNSDQDDDSNPNRPHWRVCPRSPLTVTQYHLVDRTQTSMTLTNFVLPAKVRPT